MIAWVKYIGNFILNFTAEYGLESKLPINVSLNILHELSHNNAGLQAVDLFCHGIVRKHAQSDISWYSEFSDKIIEEVRWKPKFK